MRRHWIPFQSIFRSSWLKEDGELATAYRLKEPPVKGSVRRERSAFAVGRACGTLDNRLSGSKRDVIDADPDVTRGDLASDSYFSDGRFGEHRDRKVYFPGNTRFIPAGHRTETQATRDSLSPLIARFTVGVSSAKLSAWARSVLLSGHVVTSGIYSFVRFRFAPRHAGWATTWPLSQHPVLARFRFAPGPTASPPTVRLREIPLY